MSSKTSDPIGASFSERMNPKRACMRLWYVLVMGSRSNVITPSDMPRYRTQEKAWRVLLVGNGPTHGWGVASHKDSLVGQLAVAMRNLRDQPVDVDYIGDEMMNAQTARAWLDKAPLHKYDQIVVAVGWNDAVRATPDRIWRAAMTDLMENIHDRRSPAARVIMLGIEPISASSGFGGLPGKVAQRTANRFNAYLQDLAATNEDEFLALNARPAGKEESLGSAAVYRAWAEQISEITAPLLPGTAPGRRVFQDEPEFSWVGSRHALGFNGTDAPVILDEIAKQAKAHFKVHLAQINILDAGRQWTPNHKGPVPASVPRELSYCNETAKQDDMLIVSNQRRDERFKDNAFLDQASMQFYAGQSLKSRSGEVVATFCIMDILPRPKFTLNQEKFQEFAASAQAAVWRIEDEATNQLANH